METQSSIKIKDGLDLIGVEVPIQVGPIKMMAVAVVLVASDDDGRTTSVAVMGSSLDRESDSIELEAAMKSQLERVQFCVESQGD